MRVSKHEPTRSPRCTRGPPAAGARKPPVARARRTCKRGRHPPSPRRDRCAPRRCARTVRAASREPFHSDRAPLADDQPRDAGERPYRRQNGSSRARCPSPTMPVAGATNPTRSSSSRPLTKLFRFGSASSQCARAAQAPPSRAPAPRAGVRSTVSSCHLNARSSWQAVAPGHGGSCASSVSGAGRCC